MLAERQQWIHCSVICVLSHLRQKAIVLLRCHVSLRLARRSPAGSISRCRHSVDCGGARLNGYAKEVLVSQSSEKYLVIELGVVMFTLQNNVTFPVCIAPTHRQHCHASAGSSFLTWCLFFFSYLTASWLPRCQGFNQRPLAGKVQWSWSLFRQSWPVPQKDRENEEEEEEEEECDF